MNTDCETITEASIGGKSAPHFIMTPPEALAPSLFGPDVNPPATPEDDLALRESIARDGVQVPLTAGRINGKGKYVVVKGTRRHRIALELGISEIPVEFKDYASERDMRLDAHGDNMLRRQFAIVQRAEQANYVWPLYENAEDKKEMAAKGFSPRKRAAIAGGISEGTLASFRYVLDSGNADLIDKMRAGELSIDKAYREAKKLTEGKAPIATTPKATARLATAEQAKNLRATFEDLVRATGILRDTIKRGKGVVKQAKKGLVNDPAALIKQMQAVNQAIAALASDSELAEDHVSTPTADADASTDSAAESGMPVPLHDQEEEDA